ncbi:MAG: phosphoribosyltransferase family protein, partial [Candidatus Omnitrophota bacterium]
GIPRSIEYLIEYVARELNIRIVRVKVNEFIVGYYRFNPEERAEAYWKTAEIAESLKGKKVIIIDDVVASGSTLTEMARIVLEKGAEKDDIVLIAYWDTRDNFTFEGDAMQYFADHPELLDLNDFQFTQSFLKFLLRVAESNGEGKISDLLRKLTPEKMLDLLNKFALCLNKGLLDNDSRETFKIILSEAIKIFWPELNEGGEKALSMLGFIKDRLPLREKDSAGTLYTSLSEWSSPYALFLYAYITNYDYIVLEDRRNLTDAQIEELMKIAELLKLSCTSPYFTTLPREVYTPEEIIFTEEILSQLPALRELKEEIERIRKETAERIREAKNEEEIREIAQRYSEKVVALAGRIIQMVWDNFREEFPELSEKDIAVLIGGSTGRGEADPYSDLDIDLVVKSDRLEEVYNFGRRIIQALRAVGFTGTPLDLFIQHLKEGTYLFDLNKPLLEGLSAGEMLSSFIRCLSHRYIWGEADLFRELREKIYSIAPSLLASFRAIIDNYLLIAQHGYGRVERRDFRVWWDKERNIVYDIQLGIRFFQLGVYYLLLTHMQNGELPSDVLSAIDLIFDRNLVDTKVWDRESIKEAYIYLLGLRHKNSSLNQSLYTPSYIEDPALLWENLDLLIRFIRGII